MLLLLLLQAFIDRSRAKPVPRDARMYIRLLSASCISSFKKMIGIWWNIICVSRPASRPFLVSTFPHPPYSPVHIPRRCPSPQSQSWSARATFATAATSRGYHLFLQSQGVCRKWGMIIILHQASSYGCRGKAAGHVNNVNNVNMCDMQRAAAVTGRDRWGTCRRELELFNDIWPLPRSPTFTPTHILSHRHT